MGSKSIVWIPKADEQARAELNIIEIHLAAHPPQGVTTAGPSNATTRLTNHWQIFLQVAPDKSIRLEPSPNYPNMDLTLSCSYKNYRFTKNAAKVVHLTPRTPITVGRFMEILKQNKYDKYRFTTNGTGCRYWTYRVVELLRGLGVVDDTGAKEAATALNTVWRTEQPVEAGNQTSLKDHQGTFVG